MTNINYYVERAKEYNKARYGDAGYFLWEDTVVALMFQLQDLGEKLENVPLQFDKEGNLKVKVYDEN